MDKRPNIIIFNPDQMRADALAHLGNPASQTPFLDSFAETEAVSRAQDGVCFDGYVLKPITNEKLRSILG